MKFVKAFSVYKRGSHYKRDYRLQSVGSKKEMNTDQAAGGEQVGPQWAKTSILT